MKSPIPYPGSKGRIADQIAALLPVIATAAHLATGDLNIDEVLGKCVPPPRLIDKVTVEINGYSPIPPDSPIEPPLAGSKRAE